MSTILGGVLAKPHLRRPYNSVSAVHTNPKAKTFIKAMLLACLECEKLIKEYMPKQYETQKKIIEKLRKLEGRTDFKGQSELGNRVEAEDPMFNKLGNFFHYDYQTGPNSVRPEGYVMPNYEQFINSVPNSSGGLDLAKASAEVASGDRKNNGATNTIVMPSETNGSKSGSSGIAMTTNPAGGSEDQGLSIYAAHLTLASV